MGQYRMKILQAVLAVATFAMISCETTEETASEPGSVCCRCLVDVGCVEPNEYEFCKDTLASGDTLQLGLVRSLTCDPDACIEANRCGDPNAGSQGGAGGQSGGAGGQGGGGQGGGATGVSGTYTLTVVSAIYEDRDWDGFGNDAPDPYVKVFVDGQLVGTSETLQDDYIPNWNASFTVELGGASELRLQFFDDDLTRDDEAANYTVPNLGAAIQSGGRSVDFPGGSIENVTYTLRAR
ncbi:MAG: hypothetical protein ACI9U2_003201 [Bradymonadia bacterium]|jgi:hypothetical protein